eukprot:EG_transcript_1197
MLPWLTRLSFDRLSAEEMTAVAAAVKVQLLRPTTNAQWTVICRALQFFRESANVPDSLRKSFSREAAGVVAANLGMLTKKQQEVTLQMVRAIQDPPTLGMPKALSKAPAEAPKAPPAAPMGSTAAAPRLLPRPSLSRLNGSASRDALPAATSPASAGISAANGVAAARSPISRSSAKPPQVELLETYKDNSFSDRCQQIVNGVNTALATGRVCCLLTGQVCDDKLDYSNHIAGRRVSNLQRCNTHISLAMPTVEEMKETLKVCREFLACMRPINRYVEHFSRLLKLDYEFERDHQLKRLAKNDEWDRFRLQNEGCSLFKMKVTFMDGNMVFSKSDDKPLPYSYYIYPGQTVWVSADDSQFVDPDNKNITGTGEVLTMTREGVTVKGLTIPLPPSKDSLYRVDYAVTTVNLERMQHAISVVRSQHELNLMQNQEFLARIPATEADQGTRTDNMGILEPGTMVGQAFLHNIHYSVAAARKHYRDQFGATPPPGLPNGYRGFSSYDAPPKPTDTTPLTTEEINYVVQQPHPLLRAVRPAPLECVSRPLSRTQHTLNGNQLAAVAKVIDERRQLTLIQGPPGTGKTTTAIAVICEWVMRYQCKVLATAHSNKGVDNLLQGLVKSGIKVVRVGRGGPVEGSDLAEYCLENLVERHPMNTQREQLQDQLRTAQRSRANSNAVWQLSAQVGAVNKATIARAVLKEAEVVCATCIGVGSPMMQGLQFELVLVDEATQAVEPAAMIPLTRGAKQVVMIGDQAQLPPTCKCPETLMMGFDISLFDRLIGNGLEPHVLEVQYRMHPTISCFPSWRFYRSVLNDGVTAWDRALPAGVFPTPDSRVCFLEVDGQEEQVNTSKINRMEAQCVVWMVSQLMNIGSVWLSQIGIITPYAAQVRIISQAVRSAFGEEAMTELEIHSVDGFQGREKDFILLSLVRSKVGGDMTFITDWRRTNVALTRARFGVVVAGKALALCQSTIWLDWLKFHRKSILSWDPYGPRLVPVHPSVLEHIKSLASPGEVQYSMDEMLPYKLWLSEAAANGWTPSAAPRPKPSGPPPTLAAHRPLAGPNSPTSTPTAAAASEVIDVDADDGDGDDDCTEVVRPLKRPEPAGGEPAAKRTHVSPGPSPAPA